MTGMGPKTTARELAGLSEAGLSELGFSGLRVNVGMGTCGQAAGAREVYGALSSAFGGGSAGDASCSVRVQQVGCKGLCFAEPLVELCLPSEDSLMLGHMDPVKASLLIEWINEALRADAMAFHGSPSLADMAKSFPPALASSLVDCEVLDRQERRVMEHCGDIDPMSIAQYAACGGYASLAQALAMPAGELVVLVEESGLRGRGGAGFPTGGKWRACTQNGSEERYFVVNADEGDPGAYMDRGLLESNPHRVLEGLVIASYAVGARQAYFFIRAEYPLAVRTIQKAIDDAYAVGLLGDNILGSDFSLDVEIVRGAGAFLCGESTAMVNVLENGECTTRPKPPHLTERGLWGKPTCVNNVETLACIPLIVEHGATWFRSVGTPQSPGTKIFSVTGKVERGGLVEVALGTPLGTIVGDIAQATSPKAVQVGGPSGAILPVGLDDLSISYEDLSGVNGMMGSGGFVVIGEDQCVVDTASYLVHFSARQSCGKCRPCRDGLDECARIFDRITSGQGCADDLARLEEVAQRNCSSKLCGLGRTSLMPVLSSLHYFRDEYESHLQGCCPGLTCTTLISYVIDQAKCQGERCCLLTCPGNAVKGRFGQAGRILGRLCQKCGMCMVTCPYDAVRKVSPPI